MDTKSHADVSQSHKPGRGRIYDSIVDAFGDTPTVRLHRLPEQNGVKATILAKLEYFNPAASVKDRIGSAMIVAILNVDHGWNVVAAALVALAAGAVIGLINGGLIVLLGIDSFIVTLGTSSIIAGVVLWISSSRTVGGISAGLVENVLINKFLGIPLAFWYALLLAAAIWYVLEFTPLGRRLLFTGRGRSVARLSGLRVGALRWGAMVSSGVIAAGAGVMYAGTTGSADPTSGLNYLLPAFAAAFLGATTIQPGRFSPFGTLVAVYFLATGITGLQQLGVDTFIQQLFYGSALVLAVALSQIVRRRKAIEFLPTD
mgnify:CR=1 FL=1